MKQPKILIVGAGPVGQVYGYYFQQGGCEVTYLVKECHLAECKKGFLLVNLKTKKPVRFENSNLLTHLGEAKEHLFDIAVLAMSSAALRPVDTTNHWFESFSKVIGQATVVTLQPSLKDRNYLLQFISAERLVSGVISMIAYQAPLPGEDLARLTPSEPHTAYWFLPFSKFEFSGPSVITADICSLLKNGGMPASPAPLQSHGINLSLPYISAALTVLLVSLELEHWSFKNLRNSTYFNEMILAVNETLAVVSAFHERNQVSTPKVFLIILKPLLRPVVRFLLGPAQRWAPLNLEWYFKTHFLKVLSQTHLAFNELIEEGKTQRLSTKNLENLRRELINSSLGNPEFLGP